MPDDSASSEKDDDYQLDPMANAGSGSGRGGFLGTPGMGDPPDELRPSRDRPDEKGEDGSFVVSGGGVADPAQDESNDPTR